MLTTQHVATESHSKNEIETDEVHVQNKKTGISRKKQMIIWSISCIIIAIIVFLIVFLSYSPTQKNTKTEKGESNEYYESKFLEIPSNTSCYQYSQQFASKPHVAGMTQTLEIGSLFAKIMQDLGYEAIRDDISNIVLDHYNNSQLFINGEEIDLSHKAIPGDPETNTSFLKRSWVPFSPSGDHTAPLLYINYGFPDDYDYLRNNIDIDFDNNGTGYIGIAKIRYPALQALLAGLYGLKGLILFHDIDTSHRNIDIQYPNGPEVPNFGFSTIGWPGRFPGPCIGNLDPNRLERECGFDTSQWEDLFPAIKYNIPMLLLLPDKAIQIFELMNKVSSNSRCDIILNNTEWQSNLAINTCIGGSDDIIANIITSNDMHSNDTIQNVYGYLEGDKYPDEIILIGAHRDAWGFGACDDISGTVTMLEIARSFSVLYREYGWRPKRSIKFASFHAEEWGIYGSIDFNENNNNNFSDRVVAYFNYDMTVVGGSLEIYGNPLLRELAITSAKQIKYPYPQNIDVNNGGNYSNFTLYDTWWNFDESEINNNLQQLGCLTDHCGFEYYSGIPTIGSGFFNAPLPQKLPSIYHTFYDLNGWLNIVDPRWKLAQSMAMYGGLMVLKFAQQELIPFDIKRLSLKINEWIQNDLINYVHSINNANCSLIFGNNINILLDASKHFQNNTNKFDEYYQKTLNIINNNNDDYDNDVERDIDIINNILVNIMKKMTLKYPQGMPSNKWYKQLLWNGEVRFPYIVDVIDAGCNQNELANAFQITSDAIMDAADLLNSFI